MNGGEDMTTLKKSRKQMDTYGNDNFCHQRQEGNTLLLRDLSLIMENLSSDDGQEVICFSLSIFVRRQQ